MNQREFRRYLDRDQHCPHCGTTDDTLIPQHRANRGHGGHKAGDTPANIIVLCSYMNWLIESNAQAATKARENGWKIGRYQDPLTTPVYDTATGERWLLDNNYGRTRAI